MLLRRVAVLISPLPCGQDLFAVLGVVMFDQELILIVECDCEFMLHALGTSYNVLLCSELEHRASCHVTNRS